MRIKTRREEFLNRFYAIFILGSKREIKIDRARFFFFLFIFSNDNQVSSFRENNEDHGVRCNDVERFHERLFGLLEMRNKSSTESRTFRSRHLIMLYIICNIFLLSLFLSLCFSHNNRRNKLFLGTRSAET